jgi:ribosomal protein S18 acetylase RimI-like enzyme
MQSEQSTLFRTARETDTEAMCEIAVKAWGPIYDDRRQMLGNDLFDATHKDIFNRKAEQIRDHMRRHPGLAFVTVAGTKIAGFLTYELDIEGKLGTILNNAIDPTFQGQGLGTKQYREALRIFRENGMKWAKVGTGLADKGHAAARKAYEKVGFVQKVKSVDYYMDL